jgi:hypothetical protein
MADLSQKSVFSTVISKSVGFSLAFLTLGLLSSQSAQASTFTRTSPTSAGLLPSTVSEVGGIVVDLVGSNGTRVVTQAAASSLFVGFAPGNPLTIGTQSGFSQTVISALGGGISQASVRVTLFDGDTASGDFDFNQNTLLLNGVNFGNFSTVQSQQTDGNGVALSQALSGGGFRNGTLDTGFFFSNNTATLGQLYTSLNSGNIVFGLNDLSPGDNFYDFTQGLNSSIINVGTGPVVTPGGGGTAVPEPFTIVGTMIGGAAALRIRKRLKATNKL